jgi:hypothetical protein
MWEAQYSLSDRLYAALHISEGTVFKLSKISLEYLQWISHFYHFLSSPIQGRGKKNYRENLPLLFTLGKGIFSDPSPIQNSYITSFHTMQIFK